MSETANLPDRLLEGDDDLDNRACPECDELLYMGHDPECSQETPDTGGDDG